MILNPENWGFGTFDEKTPVCQLNLKLSKVKTDGVLRTCYMQTIQNGGKKTKVSKVTEKPQSYKSFKKPVYKKVLKKNY